ncbi:hypothetical protein CCY01nite_04320 [Chitinophaga cymbidii]|uniref:PKD domain-containing protein n=2 Tax=Chitinophaga cymbidii TaxID=1096750 RepID=A0A512REQ9_9BACT|nr:hypothetical protein CCY01nite_04320 [Chitinophaga cymbidii]
MISFQAVAQQRPAPDTIPAVINIEQEENKATLKAELRPLRQIAGAPEAFYSHYWEFGDGTFSFAPQPEHHYKDTGTYDIRLYATNNYDDGKAPKSKPRRIKVKKTLYAATTPSSSFFAASDMLAMKINRMPKPGEEMVTIIGYRHPGGAGNISGSLLLFYNERQFSQKNFALLEERAHHGERKFKADSALAMAPGEDLLNRAFAEDLAVAPFYASAENPYSPPAGPSAQPWIDPLRKTAVSALLAEKKALFREQHAWRVEGLQAGEEKFLFLTLETTPEMIKDTNAVVTVSGMFIPDDPLMPLAQYDLEMQIVASHDPNRMQLKNRRMNYRFVGKKRELNYKVQFQNTGKGPASKVAIGIAVPGMLNGQTLEITDYSPRCVMCDSAYERQSCLDTIVRQDSIFFVFNNIYLKGMQQEGVEDPDSTKGFIKYKVRFSKELKKLPFSSQAAIVFDKNEPVITNRSKGSFKPGLSPGLIVGYGKGFAKTELPLGLPAGTVGVTISAYAPYKPYFQAELYLSVPQRRETLVSTTRDQRDTAIGAGKYIIQSRALYERASRLNVDVVPLHFRYNLKSWVGVGAGMIANVLVSEKVEERKVVTAMPIPDTRTPQRFENIEKGRSDSFVSWDGGLFADVNLGMVRAGPSLGVRLIQYFKEPQQRLFIYGIWRF